MGLSGTKRRTKISQDPNNTTWSKSTDGFGHKILSAHGWKPGQMLGAKDANHAEHFTAANASHIRVALREDNLGLGAKIGTSNADTFGLSTLSGIFGRLNGKSDQDVQKQQAAQRDVELRTYQTRKFGTMNFVRGGILVGDKIEDLEADLKQVDLSKEAQAAEMPSDTPTESQSRNKAKKRKHTADDQPSESLEDRRAALKAEKRERKEARRKRKAAQNEPTKDETPATSTPASGVSTPSFAGSRHNVRQRFIQQKRMASMDARALNEILMQKMPVC